LANFHHFPTVSSVSLANNNNSNCNTHKLLQFSKKYHQSLHTPGMSVGSVYRESRPIDGSPNALYGSFT